MTNDGIESTDTMPTMRGAVALDRLTPIPDAHDPVVGDGLFDLDALIVSALDQLG